MDNGSDNNEFLPTNRLFLSTPSYILCCTHQKYKISSRSLLVDLSKYYGYNIQGGAGSSSVTAHALLAGHHSPRSCRTRLSFLSYHSQVGVVCCDRGEKTQTK